MVFNGDEFIPESFVKLDINYENSERILALRHHLNEWQLELFVYDRELWFGRNTVEKHWLVLTALEARIESEKKLREKVYLNLPQQFAAWFNYDEYVDDQLSACSRAEFLAPFDHEEHIVQLDESKFYIYRLS